MSEPLPVYVLQELSDGSLSPLYPVIDPEEYIEESGAPEALTIFVRTKPNAKGDSNDKKDKRER